MPDQERRRSEDWTDPLPEALEAVGFYATANDWRARRIDTAEVILRLRRDAPKRSDVNAAECLALARSLEQVVPDA